MPHGAIIRLHACAKPERTNGVDPFVRRSTPGDDRRRADDGALADRTLADRTLADRAFANRRLADRSFLINRLWAGKVRSSGNTAASLY